MAYIPRQGDLVTLSFDPQSGREQKGRSPALVISKNLFNRRTGLAMVCPITNTRRDLPFHVPLGKAAALTGFVMVEQVKAVDFRARKVSLVEEAPPEILQEVLAVLDAFLY